MVNNVSVLIPYKPDGGQRDKIFRWVRIFYRSMIPHYELCIGSFEKTKSQGVNKVARLSKGYYDVINNVDEIKMLIKERTL